MQIRTLGAKLAVASFFGAAAISGSAFAADLSSGGDGGGYKDAAPPPSYFTDDSISFRYGTAFKEPGVNCGNCLPGESGNDIEKGIGNFQHFNTDKWGSNFIDMDLLFSTGQDPVQCAGCNKFGSGGTIGATEFYGVFRRFWSYNGITDSHYSNFLINDFGLNMGGDLGTKNDPFSEEKRSLVIGPKVSFAMPAGFLTLAVDYYHEWNHNGFANAATEFESYDVEAVWMYPFKIGDSSLKFKGFFTYIAPKGNQPCYSGVGFAPTDCKTVGEILTRPELDLDVGAYFGSPNKFEVGFAYEYWLNKFGNNHDEIPGALANTPELVARYHF